MKKYLAKSKLKSVYVENGKGVRRRDADAQIAHGGLRQHRVVEADGVLFASCHNSDDPYMTLATKTLDVESECGLFTVDLSSNVYYLSLIHI